MKLTQATTKTQMLPAGVKDKILFDDTLPGFGLRIREGGKRTWIVQYRVGAKQRRVTLGTTETLDAEGARKRAKTALSKTYLGHDPFRRSLRPCRATNPSLAANVVAFYNKRGTCEQWIKEGNPMDAALVPLVRRQRRAAMAPFPSLSQRVFQHGKACGGHWLIRAFGCSRSGSP
jgi:Arm DNA-binding domain